MDYMGFFRENAQFGKGKLPGKIHYLSVLATFFNPKPGICNSAHGNRVRNFLGDQQS
jgi:hypothetical protein